MDGLLLVDKPSGPTSHDAVARVRRTSGERRIGHTGTLDPLASGLLVLVLGKATRLATFLSGHDKTYTAMVQLGVGTDTDDAEGNVISEFGGTLPDEGTIAAALDAFRGACDQLPPRHSAKKVDGHKAYTLARRDQPVALKTVRVTVRELTITGGVGDHLELRVSATSGFYVRALARDLGARLGCGAHLVGLRRTRVGPFHAEDAIGLDAAERIGAEIERRVIPSADALADWPLVRLNDAGMTRVLHGNPIGPQHLAGASFQAGTGAPHVRIVAPDGRLVAIATSRDGALHPVVVLG